MSLRSDLSHAGKLLVFLGRLVYSLPMTNTQNNPAAAPFIRTDDGRVLFDVTPILDDILARTILRAGISRVTNQSDEFIAHEDAQVDMVYEVIAEFGCFVSNFEDVDDEEDEDN